MKNTTIRFSAILSEPLSRKPGIWASLALPPKAAKDIPKDAAMIEGIVNSFPFRASIERSGKTASIEFKKSMRSAFKADKGSTLEIEITRIGEEPETRVPADLFAALETSPKAKATWKDITPLSRREWILWLTTGKKPETRLAHIQKALSMLSSGKRRICCFGGIGWLAKGYPSNETWAPLPRSK